MDDGLITWYRKACTEELPNTVRFVALINEDITVASFISWWHANLALKLKLTSASKTVINTRQLSCCPQPSNESYVFQKDFL